VLNLGRWLEQEGYLVYKSAGEGGNGAGRLKDQLVRRLWYLLRGSLPPKVRKLLNARLPGVRQKVFSRLLYSEIDWSRTVAYPSMRSIRVNLKGREPQGVVERGAAYERLRGEIVERLSRLRDPDTGGPVLERAWKREEVYHGERAGDAPDLILLWKDHAYYTRDVFSFERVGLFEPPGTFGSRHIEHSACHRPEGIFLATGAGIARGGVRLERAEIIDLAPTILYLLGLPVPTDMDGRVLTEALDPELLARRPITYRDVAEGAGGQGGDGGGVFSDEEAEVVGQRLRDLGYLD
jgi:predicted AlkP superfamily phosphohydrolase/phosphomutase